MTTTPSDRDCSLLAPVPLPPGATAGPWQLGANGHPYRVLSTGAVQRVNGTIDAEAVRR